MPMKQKKEKSHATQESTQHQKQTGSRSRKKSTEHKIDKELEMTFPASDPPSIVQPASDKDVIAKTPTKSE
jgi:hypothetical protein